MAITLTGNVKNTDKEFGRKQKGQKQLGTMDNEKDRENDGKTGVLTWGASDP